VFQFRITSEIVNQFRHLVALLRRGISTTQKDADTHPCLEQDSNQRSQCSSGQSTRLRPLGQCDRNNNKIIFLLYFRHLKQKAKQRYHRPSAGTNSVTIAEVREHSAPCMSGNTYYTSLHFTVLW
jgi:hypothetical protein